MQGVLACNCNTYLDKIQDGLENDCGARVSLMSIWQAIHHSGYSLKKAGTLLNNLQVYWVSIRSPMLQWNKTLKNMLLSHFGWESCILQSNWCMLMSVQLTGIWEEAMVMPFMAAKLFESHSLSKEEGKVFHYPGFSIGILISVIGTPYCLHSHSKGFLLLRSQKAHLQNSSLQASLMDFWTTWTLSLGWI